MKLIIPKPYKFVQPSHPVSGKAHKEEDRSDKKQLPNPLIPAAYTTIKSPK